MGEQCARPEGEILRFRRADYTGPYRGDAGRRRATALLDRDERLKSQSRSLNHFTCPTSLFITHWVQ